MKATNASGWPDSDGAHAPPKAKCLDGITSMDYQGHNDISITCQLSIFIELLQEELS